jgi:hypothetical protein
LGPAGPGHKRLIVNNVVEFTRLRWVCIAFYKVDAIPNRDSLSKMNYVLRKNKKMRNEPNFQKAKNEYNSLYNKDLRNKSSQSTMQKQTQFYSPRCLAAIFTTFTSHSVWRVVWRAIRSGLVLILPHSLNPRIMLLQFYPPQAG